jgi:hypothetical protein
MNICKDQVGIHNLQIGKLKPQFSTRKNHLVVNAAAKTESVIRYRRKLPKIGLAKEGVTPQPIWNPLRALNGFYNLDSVNY